MKKFDLDKIKQELRELKSTSDRLDYWYNLIENHYLSKISFIPDPFNMNEDKIKEDNTYFELFGTLEYRTGLIIPKDIYCEYFNGLLEEPQNKLTYLKYEAKLYFASFKKQLFNGCNEEFQILNIRRELKRINYFRRSTMLIYANGTFDFVQGMLTTKEFNLKRSTCSEEVEYLRILNNYYENNPHELFKKYGDITVKQYAEHHYIYDYLLEKLNELAPQPLTKTLVNGFDLKNRYSDSVLEKLLSEMSEYWDAELQSFIAMFRSQSEVENFKKPVWLKKKAHLRDFWIIIGVKPTQSIIDNLIVDIKGNPIRLNKPKDPSGEYQNIFKIFKKLELPTQ